jgi:hypothetical protein
MVGFYGRFIERFSQIAEPLHSLKRKGVKFIWRDAQQLAFQQLKHALVTPVLQIPDFSKSFALMCDASDIAISAVIHQKNGEDLLPIAYSSHLLMLVERKYSAYEKECLAVVFGCEKHRTYLEHKEFELFTDNQALSWLLRHAKELGRIGRWVLHLAPFKFRVSHISGKANVVTNCLTRQHELREEVSFSGLVLGNFPEAFQLIREHPSVGPCIDKSLKRLVQSDCTKISCNNHFWESNYCTCHGIYVYFLPDENRTFFGYTKK